MKTGGIAFRLAAAMMGAALLAIVLVALTIYIGAESRVRQPQPDDVRSFFQQVATLCRDRPDILQNCPGFITDNRNNNQGQTTTGPQTSSTNGASSANPTNTQQGNGADTPPPPGTAGRGNRARFDPFDPRPWVVPMLIGGTALAGLLALGLALVIGRRIARPIEDVSKAARLVADGKLDTRVKVAPMPHNSDETTQLALSFNRMAQTLEENELERRQFIADIAHELRTPLAVMTSRLEALEDGVFELNTGEVARLQTQTRFLTRLVDDLRVLSLAEAGRLGLERRSFNLETLVADTAHSFAPRAEQAGKRIAVRVPTAAVPICGDPDRLRQVLTNLVENALKYADHMVRVTLEPNGSTVAITVSDDGDGLPPGEEAQVFDRFYRADESRNRATGGSGLGLSIVKAITELHGGTVTARNVDDGGAVFTVRLPLASTPQPKAKVLEASVA
jgi:signal transduction histidine kinase